MEKLKIGLEIHGYLNTSHKLFCDNIIAPDAKPNTNVCPVCTGMPGSKPMLPNQEAVEKMLAIAGMLDCKVNRRLVFQRKHYSWPDMPTGYQRTMSGSYALPVGVNGTFLGIGIEEVHLEEDPARWEPKSGAVDYNRSGHPLAEIVTKPEFTNAEDVRAWLKKLMTTLSYIHAIAPDFGVKADVNVSIAPHYQRVEIKNVNSFKSIVRAIAHEAQRQTEEISEGRKIAQETRAWDEATGVTVFMRSKEQAMDYMFIPEPDLPAVTISENALQTILKNLPEKPAVKLKKYADIGVEKSDAEVLSADIRLAELFETLAKDVAPALAARWLRGEFLRVLNYHKKELDEDTVDVQQLTKLLQLVETGRITESVGQKLLEQLVEKSFDIAERVKKERLEAVADPNVLEKHCRESIAENAKAVADYRNGNENALHFVVGAVMRKTKGTASPKEVNDILKKLIGT